MCGHGDPIRSEATLQAGKKTHGEALVPERLGEPARRAYRHPRRGVAEAQSQVAHVPLYAAPITGLQDVKDADGTGVGAVGGVAPAATGGCPRHRESSDRRPVMRVAAVAAAALSGRSPSDPSTLRTVRRMIWASRAALARSE